MTSMFRQIGPLRITLLTLGLLIIAFVPKDQIQEARSGWALATSVLIPALSPLVIMGLLLDALMSRVWMIDADLNEKHRLRRILWINISMSAIIVVAMIPYLQALAV